MGALSHGSGRGGSRSHGWIPSNSWGRATTGGISGRWAFTAERGPSTAGDRPRRQRHLWWPLAHSLVEQRIRWLRYQGPGQRSLGGCRRWRQGPTRCGSALRIASNGTPSPALTRERRCRSHYRLASPLRWSGPARHGGLQAARTATHLRPEARTGSFVVRLLGEFFDSVWRKQLQATSFRGEYGALPLTSRRVKATRLAGHVHVEGSLSPFGAAVGRRRRHRGTATRETAVPE